MLNVNYDYKIEDIEIYSADNNEIIRKDKTFKVFINEKLVISLTLVGKTNGVNILIEEDYDNDKSKKSLTLEKLSEGGLIDINKWKLTSNSSNACLKDQEGKTILSFIIREEYDNKNYSFIILQTVGFGKDYEYILDKRIDVDKF